MEVSNDIYHSSRENRAFEQDGDVDDDQMNRATIDNITSDTATMVETPMKKIPILNCEIQEEFRNIIIFSIFFSASVTVALICTIYLAPTPSNSHGAVSSRSKECSDIGVQMMVSGANLIDAGVGVALCEAVLNPVEYGIGSCGLLVVQDQRNNRTNAIDFACSTIDYQNKNPSLEIPTLLRGLALTHEKFGSYKWKDVLKPVADLIDKEYSNSNEKLKFMKLFGSLARDGVDVFYGGSVAQEIVYAINNQSEDMKNEFTLGQLSSYRARSVDPSKSFFHGKIIEASAGRATLSMFLLLDMLQYVTSSGKTQWNSTDFYQYYVESVKLVKQAIDANYSMVYRMDDVQRKFYSRNLASSIKASSSSPPPSSQQQSNDSSAANSNNSSSSSVSYDDDDDLILSKSNGSLINIVGPNDGILSLALGWTHTMIPPQLIQSIASSYIWSNSEHEVTTFEHGITLNERTVAETSNEGYSENYVSVLIHDTLKSCGLRLAISGSNYLDVAQVIINILGLQMNQSEAIKEPRLYVIGGKDIYYEDGFPQDVIKMLQNKGHSNIYPINSSGKSQINFGNSRAVSIVWKNMEEAGTCADPRGKYGASFF